MGSWSMYTKQEAVHVITTITTSAANNNDNYFIITYCSIAICTATTAS